MLKDREFDLNGAVAQLLHAYRSGIVLEDLTSACRPQSVAQARDIQHGLMERLGGHGGWKVGKLEAGIEPGCAPISRERILRSPAQWKFPVNAPLEIEVEVAVSFSRDLTGSAVIGKEELRASIAQLHPAMEVVSSRFRRKEILPALTTTADFQSNAGLILGPGIGDWQSLDLGHLEMELLFDGQRVAQASNGADQNQMLDALTWLANHARECGKALRKGDAILTGARIKPAVVQRDVLVQANVRGLGTVELRT